MLQRNDYTTESGLLVDTIKGKHECIVETEHVLGMFSRTITGTIYIKQRQYNEIIKDDLFIFNLLRTVTINDQLQLVQMYLEIAFFLESAY